ncbi:MAG: DUF167 domain-containing protein [Candidatus Omnitrophota bacterium]|nr:MAG: DUF167 domain-containing protein [Candidatus Omnitrophota bacterium]
MEYNLIVNRLIRVRVIAKAKENNVKKLKDGFRVYLTAPPIEGKANKALVKVLAEYFNLKKSQIIILRGKKSKDKLVLLK